MAAASVAVGLLLFSVGAGLIHDRAQADADGALSQAEATVEGWLNRYHALPGLYARDPRLLEAMKGAPEAGTLPALDRELAAWNDIAGTLDTYVMAPDGTTVAASNSGDPLSFVGRNFGFRPYFTDAMTGRPGRFFGLGITSGLRGYYLSAPIRDASGILGVVVVKVSIPALEATLSESAHPMFVSDDADVVILSTLPDLRLTALTDMPREMETIVEDTRRYDLATIPPAPLEVVGDRQDGWPRLRAPAAARPDETRTYLAPHRAVPDAGWSLHLLYDMAGIRQQLWMLAATLIAAGIALTALAALVLQRRARLIQRLADRERARLALEERVRSRTAELTKTNARLRIEVEERRSAETSLRQTQNELVQAGKMAALGQMSAALSHEFNQPLTAIRTYSENAAAFYETGRPDRASENIARVLRLTEKMARLSKHLTRFARRSEDDMRAVDLDLVLTEALALVAARVDRLSAKIGISGARGLLVQGGSIRLQHVVMNLVGNALDAVPETRAPRIEIHIAAVGDRVEMSVSDNGTGISEDALARIFDPFFTTKEVGRGLGLGLSICYNIVRDFGGTMRAENIQTETGAAPAGVRITVTLRGAERLGIAAE